MTISVEECATKVRVGEMTRTEARNLLDIEIEEAFRFEQLMRFTQTRETPFRLFTWALDWAFGEDQNERKVSMAEQMRLWEQDELRNVKEEGLSQFARRRTVTGEAEDLGLDFSRLYEELRGMGHGKFTNVNRVEDRVGAGWRPDEWIRTSVWILEAIGGRPPGGVALHGVSQRIRPSVYTAEGTVRRETASH
jgi:hypothetical protein